MLLTSSTADVTDVRDSVAYAQSLGEETFAGRRRDRHALGTGLVYGGMSMGAARAAEQVLERPGAKGAFFLRRDRAVVVGGHLACRGSTQAHVTEGDEWWEPEAEEEYVADIPGAELFGYPGSGHLFASLATRTTTKRWRGWRPSVSFRS